MNWLVKTILDWIYDKLSKILHALYLDHMNKKKDQKENNEVIDQLQKAKTSEERREANRDLTDNSF